MKYVVTGGAGFIGSHLVEHLVTAGDEVTVLDDCSTGKRENIAAWNDRLDFVEGSVVDLATCRRAFEGADFVLHQAALASVPRSLNDPVATHQANVTGTLNVLIAARDSGVKRVVYAASSSAYGNTTELPKHEGMVPRPLSPYGVSKLAGECYLRAFHHSFGLQAIALRYFNVFGPRQDPNSQYAAVVPRFITAALADQPPSIFGDGEQTRDFTFVANVVHANMLACEAPAEACGEAYNVGCGCAVSLNTLWQRIAELTHSSTSARYEPPRVGDVRDSLASLAQSRRALGYEPLVDLDGGLRATVEWYEARANPSRLGALA
jgi:UDP-N-acetylglucosamine/UDP-N-acetyl-alpha-D-glucosaminouronate 4-epimerase